MDLQSASPASPASVFAWEVERESRWSRRLLWLLLFSLCGHVASFYLLQVLYNAPVALPPKAAQITLPDPNSAEGVALAQWLLVADPALAVSAPPPTTANMLAGLPARPYTASVPNQDLFASPPRFTSDATPADWMEPNPAAVTLRPVSEADRSRPNISFAQRNAILLADALQKRLPTGRVLPNVEIMAASATSSNLSQPLQPAVFLLGVPAEGGAPLVFQRISSGRTAADEAARNALAQLLFEPVSAATEPSAPILWGEAQVQWGREAYP